jgi:hypothetical protein
MTGSSAQAKTRKQQTARAWQLANADKSSAATRTWRLKMVEQERQWREENQAFIAAWYEAPPRKKDKFFRQWAAANPRLAARLRAEGAKVLKARGEVVVIKPALARLTLQDQVLYGMSGHGSQRAMPCPGSGVLRRSWAHAEFDVLAQAYAAGLRGDAVLHVDHDCCHWCIASFAAFAKLADLDELVVHAKDLAVGTYLKTDGKFRTASTMHWAAYCRSLPEADRRRLRLDPLEWEADAAIPRQERGRPPRIQVTTPQRTAAYLRMHMPADARRELGMLLIADDGAPLTVRR